MPVASNDWCLGLSKQKTVEAPQLQCSDKVNDVPVVQVVAWVSCWRCLRLCSSPELVDIPVCRDSGLRPGVGGDVAVGIFRAPPGCPGVERQFSEPSMMKSSLSPRAPAQLVRGDLSPQTYCSVHPLQKQQQHQATGFTGRLFFFVLTSLVLVRGRTLMLHTLGKQRGDAASAGYGRTGGKSSSRCKCSWPRRNTTPHHGDR